MKFCYFYLFFCLSVYGDLDTKFHRHLSQMYAKVHMGVYVLDTKTGQAVYEHNANQVFIPASTLKVVTALTALKVLGPQFRFRTILAVDHKSYQGKLNLYLKFSGDPRLTKADLFHLFVTLQNIGFKDWGGDIIIDDSCYGSVSSYNPGMMIEDIEFCSGRPAGAIIINGNQDRMQLALPTLSDGLLKICPQETFYKIENRVVCKACELDETFNKKITGQNLVFTGCLDPTTPLKQVCIPIQDPKGFAVFVIREIFKDLGIKLQGKIKFGKVPEDVHILGQHSSEPLFLLIRPLLKNSDNLVADALFLKIGFTLNPNLKSWEQAGTLVKESVKTHYGINLSNSRMVDGSGMSRYNLLSPKQTGQLLQAAWRDPTIRSTFIAALAVVGEEGTLKNRLQLSTTHKTFYGKTGSMGNIQNLAGYILQDAKPPLIVVIMANGILHSNKEHAEFEDELVRLSSDLKPVHCGNRQD